MFKPVTRITYDMKDFLDSCVEGYCELAKVDRKTPKPAVTPFHEHRTSRPLIGEEERAGRLQQIASRVLMKILFAARMARWGLLRATQSLASRVTKWSPDCDLGLHRLVCYIVLLAHTLLYQKEQLTNKRHDTLLCYAQQSGAPKVVRPAH